MIDSDKDVWDNPDFRVSCEYVENRYIRNPTDGVTRNSRIVFRGVGGKEPEATVVMGRHGNHESYMHGTDFILDMNHNGTVDIEIEF